MTQFLEKYTSHFIWKGCVWEGVGDQIELQHIDPHSIGHNRVYFPFSWAAQPGTWGPASLGHVPQSSILSPTGLIFKLSIGVLRPLLPDAGFLYRILSPTGLVSKLTDFLSSPSYIIVQRPPSCGRHNHTHSTRPQSRLYSDIPWADAPVIYIGAFPILTARPGRRSIYNNHPPLIFQNFTCEIFLHVHLHHPHTHFTK